MIIDKYFNILFGLIKSLSQQSLKDQIFKLITDLPLFTSKVDEIKKLIKSGKKSESRLWEVILRNENKYELYYDLKVIQKIWSEDNEKGKIQNSFMKFISSLDTLGNTIPWKKYIVQSQAIPEILNIYKSLSEYSFASQTSLSPSILICRIILNFVQKILKEEKSFSIK